MRLRAAPLFEDQPKRIDFAGRSFDLMGKQATPATLGLE